MLQCGGAADPFSHVVKLYPVFEVEKQSWHKTFVLALMLVVSEAALSVPRKTVEIAQQ